MNSGNEAGIELDQVNVWFGEHEERVDAVINAGFSVPLGGSFGLWVNLVPENQQY